MVEGDAGHGSPPSQGESRLIALVAGVRRLEPGTAVTAYLDPRHALVFE
jgi:glycerol transport system ATP-binding protein